MFTSLAARLSAQHGQIMVHHCAGKSNWCRAGKGNRREGGFKMGSQSLCAARHMEVCTNAIMSSLQYDSVIVRLVFFW
jgi:hypothetical protein